MSTVFSTIFIFSKVAYFYFNSFHCHVTSFYMIRSCFARTKSSANGTLAPSAVALATNFCFARVRIPRSVLFNRERSFLLNKNGGISGIFRDFRRLRFNSF